MNLIYRKALLIAGIVVLAAMTTGLPALGVPGAINYQGRLLDDAGQPVTSAVSLTFTLWDAPSGGAQLGGGWSDSDTVTPDAAGNYSTDIGDDPGNPVPAAIFDSAQVWLNVNVGGEDLSPRARLLAVPYAVKAGAADTAATANTALGLTGGLVNPGDRIALGNNVWLQVADDGRVEVLANGQRLRLVSPRWVHPTGAADDISVGLTSLYYPQVAMNDVGDAIVVWGEAGGGLPTNLYKSEYRNGTWNHPYSVSNYISPLVESAVDPRVALNNERDAIIVWVEHDGLSPQIFKSEYRSGAWTHPSGLTDNISPDGMRARKPQVVLNDSGYAIIVWQQSDGVFSSEQVFKSEYRSGVWTHPSSLTDNISPDGQDAETPQVALNNSGDALIVWQQSDGSNVQIFKSEYRSGAWTHPSSLTDNISPDGQDATKPQVVLNDSGEAIIVWQQSDGSNVQIFKSEYRSGAWTHPSSLTDNISPDGQDAAGPQVVLNDSGEAIIVWQQSDGSNVQIFKGEYHGGSWINPSSLVDNISPDGKDATGPQVELNDAGAALIVWSQSIDRPQLDFSYSQVFMSERREDVWVHPSGLNDNISPDSSAIEPQVALNAHGKAIIVWIQDDFPDLLLKSEYGFDF